WLVGWYRAPHHVCLCPRVFASLRRRRPSSALFPYTTLFRSAAAGALAFVRFDLSQVVEHAATELEERRTRPEHPPAFQGFFRQADRKSTRLNSSHVKNSYAVFCLKKKNTNANWNSQAELRDQ